MQANFGKLCIAYRAMHHGPAGQEVPFLKRQSQPGKRNAPEIMKVFPVISGGGARDQVPGARDIQNRNEKAQLKSQVENHMQMMARAGCQELCYRAGFESPQEPKLHCELAIK